MMLPRGSSHAVLQSMPHTNWRTPGAGGIFTLTRTKLVPQVDKLGKENSWRTVQTLMAQGLIPNERDGSWLDITDGKHLRWWLWICHLGNCTRSVIGAGVHSAHVAMNMDHDGLQVHQGGRHRVHGEAASHSARKGHRVAHW